MNAPSLVAPYCGQTQQTLIPVPATIAYRQNWEESCWVMPPYKQLYPDVENSQDRPPTKAFVPPPLGRTRLWDAMQVFPL